MTQKCKYILWVTARWAAHQQIMLPSGTPKPVNGSWQQLPLAQTSRQGRCWIWSFSTTEWRKSKEGSKTGSPPGGAGGRKPARAVTKAGKMILSTGGPTKKMSQIMAGGRKNGVPLTHPVDLQGPAGSLMRRIQQAHQGLHPPAPPSGAMRDTLQGGGEVPVEGIKEINTSKEGSQSQNT